MALEEREPTSKIRLLHDKEWREQRNVRLGSARRVISAASTGAHMRELLDHLDCRRGGDVTTFDGHDEVLARLTKLVEIADRINENRRVQDDHPCRPRTSSNSIRSSSGVGTLIGSAERMIRAAALRRR